MRPYLQQAASQLDTAIAAARLESEVVRLQRQNAGLMEALADAVIQIRDLRAEIAQLHNLLRR